jgi:hypothetical protein
MPGSPHPSGLSPIQAALRFVIELGALVCWWVIGWAFADGPWRWFLALLLPTAAAAAWGTFRTPDDHSASGSAPFPVPGITRLLLELAVLLGAAVGVALVGRPFAGLGLGFAVVVHDGATVPRLRGLLAPRCGRGAAGPASTPGRPAR